MLILIFLHSRFLDILQVYHSNRNSIGEVLEHVAQLFADQEDLLTEFVFFLPEVLQDQVHFCQMVLRNVCASHQTFLNFVCVGQNTHGCGAPRVQVQTPAARTTGAGKVPLPFTCS